MTENNDKLKKNAANKKSQSKMKNLKNNLLNETSTTKKTDLKSKMKNHKWESTIKHNHHNILQCKMVN